MASFVDNFIKSFAYKIESQTSLNVENFIVCQFIQELNQICDIL